MVIDTEGNFVGVASEGDLIRAVMPDLDEVVAAGGSLTVVFRIFLSITNPITVHPSDELLKAATVMTTKMIRRLPVVANGKFLGTVSRADICWVLLCAPESLRR